jgi:hypothetical protein
MHLVQILLPLADNAGQALPRATFDSVRTELVERFGGVTTYSRAPAKGLWTEDHKAVVRDDIVVYEVMADSLDRAWWATYRKTLAGRFGQQELVIRAHSIQLL